MSRIYRAYEEHFKGHIIKPVLSTEKDKLGFAEATEWTANTPKGELVFKAKRISEVRGWARRTAKKTVN